MEEIMRPVDSSEESDEDEYVEFSIFDDDEGYIEFSDIAQGELQDDDDAIRGRLETCDPLTFHATSLWYLFTKRSYLFMIQCLQGQIQATGESILNVEPSWSIHGQSDSKLHRAVLKKWRAIEVTLNVRLDPRTNEMRLYNKSEKSSHLCLPYVEEWENIVKNAHASRHPQFGIKATHDQITKLGWLVGARAHGMPQPYIQQFVSTCIECSSSRTARQNPSSSNRIKRKKFVYDRVIQVRPEQFDDKLKELVLEYKVCLKERDSWDLTIPFPAQVIVLRCNRGGIFRRGHKKHAGPEEDYVTRERQYNTTKYCSCEFMLKIIEPIDEGKDIQILVQTSHSGHIPGSDEDVHFLPLHPIAIEKLRENLHNLNDVESALSVARRRAGMLQELAEPYERVSYRFFPTSKDVGNLAYKMQNEGSVHNDDWVNAHANVEEWIAKDMVIFHQPYNPQHEDLEKQPFVLVIQTPWMRELAIRTRSFPSRGGFYRAHSVTDSFQAVAISDLAEPIIPTVDTKLGGSDHHGELEAPRQKISLSQEVVRQCWIAGPMIGVNLLQYSITVLSVIFVGHLGALELASASIATSLASVSGYYVLLGMGSALETLCGQAYGAAQYHMLGVYLQRAILVLFTACVPLSLVFVFMADILKLVGQDAEIAEKAGEYALYLLPSLFGAALVQPVVKFLQTQSVVIPMLLCSAVTLVLHAALLHTFIFTLGWGFRGAAMATSFSFWINGILLFLYVHVSVACRATWNGFSKEAFVDLYPFLQLAVPSCVMLCLEYWCFEILVLSGGLLPNPQLEISALSVCISMTTLNYMIPFGLSAGASTRVANELGAGNARAAKYAVHVAMSMSACQATIVGCILVALRFHWGWVYSNDAQVVHYVGTLMPFIACVALFDGIQGVLSGVARGSGRQELGAYINLCTFYVIGIPIALVLAFYFNLGGPGLFVGLLCGLGTQMLTLSIVTLRTDWDKQMASSRVLHDEHEKLEGFEMVPNDIV